MPTSKPMLIYLTGQNNFGNRGCEALVRSTVQAVRAVAPQARFLVPSGDIASDSAQWPGAAAQGVQLVPVAPVPWLISKWGGLCMRLPAVAAGPWPALPSHAADMAYIDRADVVLSIGGDNLSLDYGVASLAYFVAVAEMAISLGKPVGLWGASVGPFARMPAVERHMVAHLKRLSFLAIRESRSFQYLSGLGVTKNMVPVVDTAFLMQPQTIDLQPFWPAQPGDGVVGLNVGKLVEDLRSQLGQPANLVESMVAFVRRILEETGLAVLLVPHVAPLDGSLRNNDEHFNARVYAALEANLTTPAWQGRVGCVPGGLNAPQLKHVISKCRYLIAARTHATIAAFSSAVPTVSIAYSVKAEGINEDLFGHMNYVLRTPDVDATSLWGVFTRLVADEETIRARYAQGLPGWRRSASEGALCLLKLGHPAPSVAHEHTTIHP